MKLNFLKYANLVQFCLIMPKNLFGLMHDNWKCQKMFLKGAVVSFTWFFGHCTAKKQDIHLKFCGTVPGIKLLYVLHFCEPDTLIFVVIFV